MLSSPPPILAYSQLKRCVSSLAVIAVLYSILAFPLANILPIIIVGPSRRAPCSAADILPEFICTVLPLFIAQVLANRSLARVLHSRRTPEPLEGLNYAIAAVNFSSAWIILLTCMAFYDN